MSDAFTVIPAPEHRRRGTCQTCLDDGYIEVEDCTCGDVTGAAHARWCGMEPCPEGCSDMQPP